MPLLGAQQQFQQGPPNALPEPEAAPRPAALDIAAAAFIQNNVVSSLYERATHGFPQFTPVPEYDVLDDIKGYEDNWRSFLESESPEETAFIRGLVDSERSNQKVLQDAGGWGLAASIGAGVLDPATLASMALPVAKGATLPSTIGRMVTTQAAVDTASELAFHSLQETRTVEQSFINVGASTILTGVLGAIAVKVPAKEFAKLEKAISDEIVNSPLEVGARSMGAAQRGADLTITQESIAGIGQRIARTIGRINPLARLMTSQSKVARQVTQDLAETPFMLTKNEQLIANVPAVETLIKKYDAPIARISTSLDESYKGYVARLKPEGQNAIKFKQFREEVAGALRRGDESKIPEVQAMARQIRSEVLDPLKKQLQKVGLLGEDVVTAFAQSYLPRLYNVMKIKNNRTAWEDTLNGWFRGEGIDELEARALTNDVTRTILGTIRGMTDFTPQVVVKAGPLKERTLAIPDHVLEPFLENNIEKIMSQHIRTVAPQLEIARRFDGDLDMKQAIQNIKDDYDIKLSAAKNDAEKKALDEALKSDIEDIKGLRDRLLGRAGIPADPDSKLVRGARLMRNYSYVRLLGSQMLSSIADAGRIMTQYGMAKTARSMAVFATNLKAWKGTREEARRMAVGLDWTLNTRGATLGDIGEYAETAAEEYAQKAANMFTRVTGMATWNSSMKFLASALQQDEILRAAIKGGASQRKLAQFAQIGIAPSDLKKIARQFEKHGETDGLHRARTDLWDDKELALKYEAAILKAADTAVLTKGVGDTPLFMSSELGKTIFQFKSFGMAAVNRLIIPVAQGLQRRDLAVMNGLMAMLALGYLRYAAKQWTSDRPIDTDAATVMKEAIDGAGLTTYLAEPYDVFAGMMDLPRFSRYKDRSWLETMAGPNAGTITDMMGTVSDMRRDGVSQRDIHKMRKLLPYQNLFYLRRAINALEEGTGDALGVPEEAP